MILNIHHIVGLIVIPVGTGLLYLSGRIRNRVGGSLVLALFFFLGSTLAWTVAIWIPHAIPLDPLGARIASKGIFCAVSILCFSVMVLAIELVGMRHEFYSYRFGIFSTTWLVVVLLVLTGQVESGVKGEPLNYSPVYGWAHKYFVGSSVLLVVYLAGVLYFGWRTASGGFLRFQISAFGAWLLVSVLGSVVFNAVLPLLGVRRFVYLGPLSVLVVYFGLLSLLLRGRVLYFLYRHARAVEDFLDITGQTEENERQVASLFDFLGTLRYGGPEFEYGQGLVFSVEQGDIPAVLYRGSAAKEILGARGSYRRQIFWESVRSMYDQNLEFQRSNFILRSRVERLVAQKERIESGGDSDFDWARTLEGSEEPVRVKNLVIRHGDEVALGTVLEFPRKEIQIEIEGDEIAIFGYDADSGKKKDHFKGFIRKHSITGNTSYYQCFAADPRKKYSLFLVEIPA